MKKSPTNQSHKKELKALNIDLPTIESQIIEHKEKEEEVLSNLTEGK